MTPEKIITRIIELGLNEDTPDTALQTKATNWFNDAYKEIYFLCAKWASPILLRSQSLTTSSGGVGAIPLQPLRIKKVIDLTNKRELKPIDLEYLLSRDPTLVRTGAPEFFYTDGALALNVWPASAVSIALYDIPPPVEIVYADPESAIKIPTIHHEVLIWTSLVQGMTYERGFGNADLLQVANIRKGQLLENLMLDLALNTPKYPQRSLQNDF